MSKPLIQLLQDEVNAIGSYLIEASYVDDQNFPTVRKVGRHEFILEADYWADSPPIFAAITYSDLYERLLEARAFDFRLLDGALIQLRFNATRKHLKRARLAYFPAPDLTPFQEDPELYLFDEQFAEVVDLRAVTVPLRFDFDDDPGVVAELDHPHSHLTLGQYQNCRIPMTSGVTPFYFFQFILRHFYRTKTGCIATGLPGPKAKLTRTITALEASFIHLGLPHL